MFFSSFLIYTENKADTHIHEKTEMLNMFIFHIIRIRV